MGKKRLVEFDIAKGIGILCIILGHFGIYSFNRVVYIFHVPLFFIISGYFLSDKDSLLTFFKKKVRTLMLPYYITGICIVILSFPINCVVKYLNITHPTLNWYQWIVAVLYGAGSGFNLPDGVNPIGAIWFLPALFWALIETKFLISKYIEGHRKVFLYFFLFSFSFIGWWTSRFFWLPQDIQISMVASVYVYFGYILKKEKIVSQLNNKFFGGGSILLFLYCIYCWNDSFSFARLNMSGGIIYIICSFSTSILIIDLCVKLSSYNNSFIKLLAWYGRNSLLVLCVHLVQINMIPNPYSYVLKFWSAIIGKIDFINIKGLVDLSIVFIYVLFATGIAVIINKVSILFYIFHGYKKVII